MPTYVAHVCRNKKCNVIWIDKDLTNSTVFPPNWKYCKECAAKLGIDYEAQTPDSNLTEKELAHKNKLRERAEKMRQARLNKICSAFTETGQEQAILSQQDKLYLQKI